MPKFKVRPRFRKAQLRKDAAATHRPEKCVLPSGIFSRPTAGYPTHFRRLSKEYVVPRRALKVAGYIVRTVLDFANCPENRKCFSMPGTVSPMAFASNNCVLYGRIVDAQLLFSKKTHAKHARMREEAEANGTFEAFSEWYQELEYEAYRDAVYGEALPFVQAVGIMVAADRGSYSYKHWEALEGTEDGWAECGGKGRSYYVNIEAAKAFCSYLADEKILTYNAAREKPLGLYTAEDIEEARKSAEAGASYSKMFARRLQAVEDAAKKGFGKELMLDLPRALCQGNIRLARWKAMAVIQKLLMQHHPECLVLMQLSERLNKKETIEELHTHVCPKLKTEGHVHFSLRETSAFAQMSKAERAEFLASKGLDMYCFDIKASALTMAYVAGHGALPDPGTDLYACVNAAMGRRPFAGAEERDAFKLDVNVARSAYSLDAVSHTWCKHRHCLSLEGIAARKAYLVSIRAAVAEVCRCLPDNGFYVLEGLFVEWCREYLLRHGVKHVGIVYDEICLIQDAGTRTHEEAQQLYDRACKYALHKFMSSGLQAKFQENFKYIPEISPISAFIGEEDTVPAA